MHLYLINRETDCKTNLKSIELASEQRALVSAFREIDGKNMDNKLSHKIICYFSSFIYSEVATPNCLIYAR